MAEPAWPVAPASRLPPSTAGSPRSRRQRGRLPETQGPPGRLCPECVQSWPICPPRCELCALSEEVGGRRIRLRRARQLENTPPDMATRVFSNADTEAPAPRVRAWLRNWLERHRRPWTRVCGVRDALRDTAGPSAPHDCSRGGLQPPGREGAPAAPWGPRGGARGLQHVQGALPGRGRLRRLPSPWRPGWLSGGPLPGSRPRKRGARAPHTPQLCFRGVCHTAVHSRPSSLGFSRKHKSSHVTPKLWPTRPRE